MDYIALGHSFWTGFWIAVTVQAVVCGALSAHIADSKGHNSVSWFFVGLLFGILGLIAAAGLPDRLAIEDRRAFEDAKPENEARKNDSVPWLGHH